MAQPIHRKETIILLLITTTFLALFGAAGAWLWQCAEAGPDHTARTGAADSLPLLITAAVALVLLLIAATVYYHLRLLRNARGLAYMEKAFEGCASALAIYDAQGKCTFANRAYFAITGEDPASIPGLTSMDRRENYSESGQFDRMRETVRSGGAWREKMTIRNKTTGGETTIDLVVTPLLFDGSYEGAVASFNDVTEEVRTRKKIEVYAGELRAKTEELTQAQKDLEADVAARERAEREKAELERKFRRSQTLEAVGQLAGGVAHDFNNVLGTILAALHSLQVATRGDKRFESELDQIRDLCAQGGEFTRRLLAVGRRGSVGVGPVNLSELMESLQLLLSHTLPKNIRLEFQVAPRLPAVTGNRADLLTAFLNLALNARDAMPDGGGLAIACRLDTSADGNSARVAIDVSDTGCGIPLEIQDRIFEPFFTTKPHGVGTGLGLATVYATVTEASGDILVSSLPGRGTTFNVRLPSAARGDNTQGAPFRNDGYILVAEKDPATALEVVKILEDAGYSTLKAGTGIEVLEILRDRREHIELLFLGGELPDQRATAVRRCLKLMAPEIPVCCVCGAGEECETEGPHLLKPLASDDLLRAVGELLDAKNRT